MRLGDYFSVRAPLCDYFSAGAPLLGASSRRRHFQFYIRLLSVFCFHPVGTFALDSLSTDRSHYFSPVSLLALSAVLTVDGYSFDSVTRVSWFVCEFAGFNC